MIKNVKEQRALKVEISKLEQFFQHIYICHFVIQTISDMMYNLADYIRESKPVETVCPTASYLL